MGAMAYEVDIEGDRRPYLSRGCGSSLADARSHRSLLRGEVRTQFSIADLRKNLGRCG